MRPGTHSGSEMWGAANMGYTAGPGPAAPRCGGGLGGTYMGRGGIKHPEQAGRSWFRAGVRKGRFEKYVPPVADYIEMNLKHE